MSLLDRVQRNADGGPAPAPAPAQQPAATPAPAPSQPANPSGWQTRHTPQQAPVTIPGPSPVPSGPAPATPAPATPAPAAVPAPAARPAGGGLLSRSSEQAAGAGGGPSSLLNRTGGIGRGGLSKGSGSNSAYSQLRSRVHQKLVEELAANQEAATPDQVQKRIAELVNDVVTELNMTMTRQDRQRVVETVVNDVLGLGPLEDLLADPTITEIMINGPKQIYIEQKGKILLSPTTFDSTEQLMQVIDRIVSSIGRRIDESSPMVDARLKDGSRVNVIIPPLALKGPTVTIRKFAKEALTIDDLVKYGSITEEMVTFLRACVRARMNCVVSGGTGSGKTTTLNILSSFIPEDERIVTIEDAAELQLRQEHVVTLETRPANVEGRGRVAIRDLVINSLRMRPDRIVIGECRGGEALDMLQAMNTGHDGSLTTLHANNPRDCIGRLETLVLMAGTELPSRAIREQIGSAVHIIVQQSRLRDGSRKIVSITEVLGTEKEEVRLQEIFTFKQTAIDENGKVVGQFMPTGAVPRCLDVLKAEGEEVSESIFQPVHLVEEPVEAGSGL